MGTDIGQPREVQCRESHLFTTRAKPGSTITCPQCRRDTGTRVAVWVPVITGEPAPDPDPAADLRAYLDHRLDAIQAAIEDLARRLDAAMPPPPPDPLDDHARDLAAGFGSGPFTIDDAAGHWETARRTANNRITQLANTGRLERLAPAARPGAGSRAGRAPTRYRVRQTEEASGAHS